MEDRAGVRKRKRDGAEAVGVSGDAAVGAGYYDKELLLVVVMEDECYEGIAEESVEEVMRWLETEISPAKGDHDGGGFVTINGNEESCGPSFSAAASTVMATVDARAGGPSPPPTAVPWPWPWPPPDQAESSSREEGVDTADLPVFDEEWLVELHRSARGEGNQHISTRVMGTFGYVAPEYAMTGHLLVKSDVYSYGVVLLELLTGRKPVDMSQPEGQESLVSWARPYLTNVVNLRQAVDPLLGPNTPLDSVAKAAAIASMCIQPEVAHRPSMGEVVQALKLVCSDGDDGLGSGSFSQELAAHTRTVHDVTGMEAERVLLSEMFGSTPVFTPDADPGSFHKQSSSGPLMTGKNRKFWQRLRSLSRGSMSEHGASPDFETRSQCSNR